MDNSKKFSVIIVAAGSGSRMGCDLPKQYIELQGRTILRHTLDVFSSINELQDICVVINPAHEKLFKQAIMGLENIKYCTGGDTRQLSVCAGLKQLSHLKDDDLILVHDAARPFVRPTEIDALINAMSDNDAATLASPIADTLRYDNDGKAPSRKNLWAIQTPQAFRYGALKQAHDSAGNENYTDDASLFPNASLVNSSKQNFKITTSEDLDLAEKLLSTNLSTRTGMGYDVHAFDNDCTAKNVRLCGIDIPHDRKLKGHSDADVALHALCDAILGAIGKGDIGLHFPPSNDKFKNMDSAKFVEHAVNLLKDKGGYLINADITLICEAPKIGKYREQMRSGVAKIIGAEPSSINISATTTEKLGFTGRREGIAAQAVVSVRLPQV